MVDREKKYSENLAGCRKSIQRTKDLIEYHKKMLKSLEGKEKELIEKLEREKFSGFYKLLNQKGYDIDAFKSAVESGDFDSRFAECPETTELEDKETTEQENSDTPAIEKDSNVKERLTDENERNALRAD